MIIGTERILFGSNPPSNESTGAAKMSPISIGLVMKSTLMSAWPFRRFLVSLSAVKLDLKAFMSLSFLAFLASFRLILASLDFEILPFVGKGCGV